MADTAFVIVDTTGSEDLSDQSVNAANGLVKKAQNTDAALFYVLPEGEDLHEAVEGAEVASVLRYDPDSDNPYYDARVDEQLAGRGISNVNIVGPSNNVSDFASKEQERGRSVE